MRDKMEFILNDEENYLILKNLKLGDYFYFKNNNNAIHQVVNVGYINAAIGFRRALNCHNHSVQQFDVNDPVVKLKPLQDAIVFEKEKK